MPEDQVDSQLSAISLVREPIHLKLSEWAYKFGNIYTIHLGSRPALIISDVATMKEIFSIYPASTGKLLTDVFAIPFGGKYGLLNVDGEHWQEQRQFCIKKYEAVILETLRIVPFFPLGIFHEMTEDVRFQKYFLPKGTVLIANLNHVQHDAKIWGDPENFRPERFLSGDKSLRENVVVFQVGKRQCLGEGLSKDIMFLFTSKLFQKFNFSIDPSHEAKEYLEPDMGFMLATKHLPIVVGCRDTLINK